MASPFPFINIFEERRKGMGNIMEYHVTLNWDNEAEVWYATSEDIIGLILESESMDSLIKRVKMAVPELLELNKQKPAKTICFLAQPRLEAIA